METSNTKDGVLSESPMTTSADESPIVIAEEGTTTAVARIASTTTRSHSVRTAAANASMAENNNNRVTPSPSVRAVAAASARSRVDKSDSADSSDSDDDCLEIARYARKNSIHSPTVIDLCNATPEYKNDESDSSSDEDDDSVESFLLRQAKKPKTSQPVRPLPKLSIQEQEEILDSIEKLSDAALQRLLWDIGFRYTLKLHQYEAVRAVAGLPPNFPLREDGMEYNSCKEALQAFSLNDVHTKGLLLADEMGLGKTVQSIAGMILRVRWFDAHNKKRLPSIVIGPNDAVLKQWEETLIMAGVNAGRIKRFKPRSIDKLEGNTFVLMTRYNLQTEVKYVMDGLEKDSETQVPNWPLFPNATKPLMKGLQNQYKASNGKARNKYRLRRESEADCVVRLLSNYHKRSDGNKLPAFCTVVIDEVHFLKNTCAYWGLGAGLLGLNAERLVALSGTPYNNGPQDMAAIMSFIDSSHAAARKDWWETATAARTGRAVAEAVRGWRSDYMLLRKKEIVLKQLPPKTVTAITVSPYPQELFLYKIYEEKFLILLDRFSILLEDGSPEAQRKKTEMFTHMCCIMSNMRKILIHPMLACGREASISFSPSRKQLLPLQEKKNRCVYCCSVKDKEEKKKSSKGENKKRSKDEKKKRIKNTRDARKTRRRDVDMDGLLDMDLDESGLDDEDEDDDLGLLENERTMDKGAIVPLQCNLCHASDGPVRHFAHEACRDFLLEEGLQCPACELMKSTVHLVPSLLVDGNTASSNDTVSHNMYCTDVSVSPAIPNGFKASAKIEAVINWHRSVPKNDKAIILSFFKGGLDLLEGVLTTHFGVDCARFDGDINADVRNVELARFKESKSCRVLLATVQSGGTGLNIVEANHVCFLDRWFNPCVHEQAQDRCHRINQTKEVKCAFHDVNMTVDDVMAHINTVKSTNASVLLADGTELGARTAGLGYMDMTGLIGKLIKAVRCERISRSEEFSNTSLPPLDSGFLTEVVEQQQEKLSGKVKPDPGSSQESTEIESSQESSNSSQTDIPARIPKAENMSHLNSLDVPDSDDDSLLLDAKPTFKTHSTAKETSNTVIDLSFSDDEESLMLDLEPTFKRHQE